MFIYFWETDRERERETETEWRRGRERGRHRTWSGLQTLCCQHRAWRRARTHEPWDHDLSQSRMLNPLSHPGAPDFTFYLKLSLNTPAHNDLFIYFLFLKFFNVSLFLRERDTEFKQDRSRDREKETQNLKQAPSSELSAHSPMWGFNSWFVRSWPEPKSGT